MIVYLNIILNWNAYLIKQKTKKKNIQFLPLNKLRVLTDLIYYRNILDNNIVTKFNSQDSNFASIYATGFNNWYMHNLV